MKIAILTQPLKNNYGGILQAYALQQIIKSLGHEVITINRQVDYRSKSHEILKKLYSRINIFTKKNLFIKQKNNDYESNTLEFINKNIKTSNPIRSTKELKHHFSKNMYDAVVVGSDQTWRPMYSPNIFNFYLDFIENNNNILKISYASSFGVDEWEYTEIQTEKCKALAKKFNAVSIREISGINLCKTKLNVSAEHVLDPTLLMRTEDYLNKLNINTKNNKQNLLLTYILDPSIKKRNIIKSVADKLSLTELSNNEVEDNSNSDKLSKKILPKVNDWVKSFSQSNFIITDSFHGCVFSIIFNKPFVVIGNNKRGMARFNSLLSIFDLNERLISEDNTEFTNILDNQINWEIVNKILENKREKSIQFLIKNLNASIKK